MCFQNNFVTREACEARCPVQVNPCPLTLHSLKFAVRFCSEFSALFVRFVKGNERLQLGLIPYPNTGFEAISCCYLHNTEALMRVSLECRREE